jgi:CBS domain-containing protein
MTTTTPNRLRPLVLRARTAADLMTADPKSLRRDATVAEAAAFLTSRGFSAAPVIDDAGRPVGVVSRTDLLHHQGRRAVHLLTGPLVFGDGTPGPGDALAVRAVMTPAVFRVHTDAAAAEVVDKMLALNVRRLFVVDDDGVLVGVISASDVLRRLGRADVAVEWEGQPCGTN